MLSPGVLLPAGEGGKMLNCKEFNKDKDYVVINTDGIIKLKNGGVMLTFDEWKTLAEWYYKLVEGEFHD